MFLCLFFFKVEIGGNFTPWEHVWLVLFFHHAWLLSVRQSEAWIGCLDLSDVCLRTILQPHQTRRRARAPSSACPQYLLDWWGCGRGRVWIQECSHCLVSELSFVPTPLHWLYPFSRVCWMMSLSLCLDSDRHCVTSCLQTHRLWDNITVAHGGGERGWMEGRRRREGGETDVQTDLAVGDGQLSYINHGLTAAEPLCCSHS